MLYRAAMVISESLTPEEQQEGRTFPHIKRIRAVTKAVAKALIIEGRKSNLLMPSKIQDATDDDLDELIERKMYIPVYTPLVPKNN